VKPYVPDEWMPPIPRNFRLPDFSELPERIQKLLPEPDLHLKPRPHVCIRAFVFYGAGDTWYAWANLAATAPPYVEVAVHEWPSHGSRDEEEPSLALDKLATDAFKAIKPAMEQHASGGRIEGAPFVLIGHSIGCLVVTALSKMLREEFGLEPAAVIMLDRGPPHIPLHSEQGQKLRDEDPWEFMKDYNTMVHSTATAAGGERGQKMIDMWINDCKVGSDTREIGYHKFECEMLLLRAAKNIDIEGWRTCDDPEKVAKWQKREPLMGSPTGWAMDCSPEQYDEWSEWVEPGKLIVKDIITDHIGIKSHKQALEEIWDLVNQKKAPKPTP